MSIKRQTAGLFTAAALTAGALFATAAPAQAYSPNPTPHHYTYDTDNCPCSGGNLSDPFDGTYLRHDPGGKALKVELYDDGWFIGKIEFHPYDEKLWIYDTKNDGDTIYVRVSYEYDGVNRDLIGPYRAPGTSDVVEYDIRDFHLPEGTDVFIYFYDGTDRSDYIGGGHAVA